MTERIDTLPADDRLLLRYASVVGQWFDLDVLRERGRRRAAGRHRHRALAAARPTSSSAAPRMPSSSGTSCSGWRRTKGCPSGDAARSTAWSARCSSSGSRAGPTRRRACSRTTSSRRATGRGPGATRSSPGSGRARASRTSTRRSSSVERSAPPTSSELPRRSRWPTIAEALGDVCELSARYEDARGAYRRARAARADDPAAQLRLTRKEGTLLERLGHYDEAVAWFERALEAAPRDDDALRAARSQSSSSSTRSCSTARVTSRTASASARRPPHGPSVPAPAARSPTRTACSTRPTARSAGSTSRGSRKALPIYEELGDPIGRAIVLNNWGIRAYYAGRWGDAQAYYEQSREAEHTSGDVVRAATASNNEAEILLDQGHTERAAELFHEALRVYRASGYTFGAAVVVLEPRPRRGRRGTLRRGPPSLRPGARGARGDRLRELPARAGHAPRGVLRPRRAATRRRSSSRPRRSRRPRRPGRPVLGSRSSSACWATPTSRRGGRRRVASGSRRASPRRGRAVTTSRPRSPSGRCRLTGRPECRAGGRRALPATRRRLGAAACRCRNGKRVAPRRR